ncbi:MAG: hypothetical protein MZV63_20480 [Marinilabiliales bacterium]|nr:hypothetical protein [Marinilabiliales bacterium]
MLRILPLPLFDHILAEDHGRQHGTLEVQVEDAVKPFDVEIEKGPFQVFVISA